MCHKNLLHIMHHVMHLDIYFLQQFQESYYFELINELTEAQKD